MRRVSRATLVAALLFMATGSSVFALPILDTVDAEELAADLADATAEQGICYGWNVSVQDESGEFTGDDVGSNLGVGESAVNPECDKWIVFSARIHYTSESSEAEDSADWTIESNLDVERSTLVRLGITDGALLSGDDDVVIANATRALPALAAEEGVAEPVPLEIGAADVPDADKPTGSHGSDWLRAYWAPFALGIGLVVFGALWIAVSLFRPTFLTDIKEQLDDDD